MLSIDLIPLLKSWTKALDCINHVIYTPALTNYSLEEWQACRGGGSNILIPYLKGGGGGGQFLGTSEALVGLIFTSLQIFHLANHLSHHQWLANIMRPSLFQEGAQRFRDGWKKSGTLRSEISQDLIEGGGGVGTLVSSSQNEHDITKWEIHEYNRIIILE